jgi:hypothetical protein
MICPQCKTANDDEYIFCVNCGISIGDDPYVTVKLDPRTQRSREPLPETVFVSKAPFNQAPREYPSEGTLDRYQNQPRSRVPLFVGIAFAAIAVVGTIAFFATRPAAEPERAEVLPDHLGLFWQKGGNSALVEIRKLDFANALDGRNAILKDENVPQVVSQPELILYADAAEVPLSDLRFVKLDTLTDDGKVKFLDFQASLVDEKPAMKRIRFEKPLESGRYAFALFSGFVNEGKHRLWPIEVRDSTVSAGQFTQELSLSTKPVEVPSEKPVEEVQIPAGATIAYCTGTDVRLRSKPGTKTKIIGKLAINEKVYVTSYSDIVGGGGVLETWAKIQTERGKQGWVFNAFLDHGKK